MILMRTIRYLGILNFILLLLACFGLMACIFSTVALRDKHTPTVSDIADSKKDAISFETLTEKQLQEGSMVEGKILFNMGNFTDSVDEKQESYTHYAILLGDKVMSIALYDTIDNMDLKKQARNYTTYLTREGLSIWQYHDENDNSKKNKKKSKKNQKTVKQVIQENMANEPGVEFRGKVVKMDAATEEALRNYVIPEGETEPVFETIPYEIKCTRPVDLAENILAYVLTAIEGIVGIAALIIMILRIWAHKTTP